MIGQWLQPFLEKLSTASSEGAQFLILYLQKVWGSCQRGRVQLARQNVILHRHHQMHPMVQGVQDSISPVSLLSCALVRFIATIVTLLPTSPHSAFTLYLKSLGFLCTSRPVTLPLYNTPILSRMYPAAIALKLTTPHNNNFA